MSSNPLVSIIILNWNGRALMEKCLPSVLNATYPNFEVIIVDNASSDDSVSWVQKNHPDVRLLALTENGGFSIGNNAGIAIAKGEYMVLLNNDVEVDSDWLAPLVTLMEREPIVAAVQPKMLQYDKRDTFEYAGACGGMLDKYGYGFARGRIFEKVEEDKGQYNQSVEIFWACGAAMCLRKSAIQPFGDAVLDPQFFMHFEEIDLCWRLWRSGWQIKVEPQSKIYHIGGASLNQSNPKKTYYNFRNSLLTLYKNLSPSDFTATFRTRKLIDRLAIIVFWMKRQGAHASAVKKAYQDFQDMKTSYSPPETSTKIAVMYPKSILWKKMLG